MHELNVTEEEVSLLIEALDFTTSMYKDLSKDLFVESKEDQERTLERTAKMEALMTILSCLEGGE